MKWHKKMESQLILPLNPVDLQISIDSTYKSATIIKTIEEMGELTQVLAKYVIPNGMNPEVFDVLKEKAIPEELADVLIMCLKLRAIFGEKRVDDYMMNKFNRHMRTIIGDPLCPQQSGAYTAQPAQE